MISVKKYIESNKDRFIEELFSLIRIPSISAKHEHKPDMEACAKRWTELLLAAGADKAVVMQTEGNPVVYGEKMVSSASIPSAASNKRAYSVETERFPFNISFSNVGETPICNANFRCEIPRYSISSFINSPGCMGLDGVKLLAIILGSIP